MIYTLAYRNVGGAIATNVVITETVPAHTSLNAAASTSGWSCPDASPPGTVCTLHVPDMPPASHGSALFAVRVDDPADTRLIRNSARIASTEVLGSGGEARTFIGAPVTVPLLGVWGFGALLTTLIGAAAFGLRRRTSA